MLGQGVVVASIDTGVEYTHPALVGTTAATTATARSPTTTTGGTRPRLRDAAPCDNVGHGTHTMGTMVGGDGPGPFTPDIGVAPGATGSRRRAARTSAAPSRRCCRRASSSSPRPIAGANPGPASAPTSSTTPGASGPTTRSTRRPCRPGARRGSSRSSRRATPARSAARAARRATTSTSSASGATDERRPDRRLLRPRPVRLRQGQPGRPAPGRRRRVQRARRRLRGLLGDIDGDAHTGGHPRAGPVGRPAPRGNFDAAVSDVRSTAVDRLDDTCGGDEDGDPNNVYGDGRIDAGAAATSSATGGTLSGTVTARRPTSRRRREGDRRRRDPDFPVNDRRPTATTRCSFAAGVYGVTVTAFGYFGSVNARRHDRDRPDDHHDVEPRRCCRASRSPGTVTAAENGGPLPDVSVRAVGTPVAAGHDQRLRALLPRPADRDVHAVRLGQRLHRDRHGGDRLGRRRRRPGLRALPQARRLRSCLRPDRVRLGGRRRPDGALGDDVAGRLRLPFSFPFYGESYDKAFISSNGYLNFLEANADFIPTAIPSALAPNAAIYAFWADL